MAHPNRTSFWKKTLPIACLMLAILACSTSPAIPTAPAISKTAQARLTPAEPNTQVEIPIKVGHAVRGSFYELYFTDPLDPAASLDEGGPDGPLAAAIDEARMSVDVAIYSISLNSIQNALINAHKRGVEVRVVMESDNMGDRVPQALKDAGIPMIGDRRQGLMHDKFVVIDRAEVWTGSMNFTYSGAYQDNNNLIRIRSLKVADDYTVEFDEMFTDDFFGPDIVSKTPNPKVTLDGVPIEVYFSPDDHVARRIVTLLRGAEKSIKFMAYSFTANDFGDIIIQKAKEKLSVAGVMDADMIKSNAGSEYIKFSQAGLSVFPDGNPSLMHDKVIIIDNEIVITGSYNFTSSAERINDENVVIFFDRQIATSYLAEFERIYSAAPKIQTQQ
ncbi:MAG TPA: phospholipase D-like domain-containing protein [Anaerolineales bacterium]|jgi:phosphatidylserine/phosphatidylglycerophosphate/cardiolipin synthase-like enzyme